MRKCKDADRLAKMLLNDGLRMPGQSLEMVKNELIGAIDAYFDVDEKSVEFIVQARDDGAYVFCFQGLARGAKKVRTVL